MDIKEELYSSHRDTMKDTFRVLVCGSVSFDIAAVVSDKVHRPVNSAIKSNVGIMVYKKLEHISISRREQKTNNYPHQRHVHKPVNMTNL
jgi:hypothetical protein